MSNNTQGNGKTVQARDGTTHDLEDVLSKIRRLDALTQSGNEHEAALAASRVQAFLFKYNLDMQDVGVEVDDEREYINELYNMYSVAPTDNLQQWRRILLEGICRANFCRTVIPGNARASKGKVKFNLNIVGRRSNVKVALYMYEYLANELYRLADQEWNRYWFFASKDPKQQWRNGFLIGGASSIYRKLQAQREASEAQYTGGTALARRDEAETLVALTKFFPNLRRSQPIKVQSYDGYNAGKEQGEAITISDAIEDDEYIHPMTAKQLTSDR